MSLRHLHLLVLLTLNPFTSITRGQESYPVHPDSAERHEGVPQGRVESYRFTESRVYPGTEREYFVYVPAQYDPNEPAALMVFQDGRNYARETGPWRVPIVFDNLIASGEMPVTIAVCINPGVVPGGEGNQNRFNRSLEYDTVSDRYATFLIDELLPEVQKKYTITEDPNLRGIAGSSSGAIAAFGVAWHRPDQFRRVFSTVGTFVGLRGGNEYPTLIRKTEPKPIRVFLQDGKNDLDIYGGSWWNANLTMLSALRWGGYEVENVWGDGGHNGKHGGAIFPDAMRWLWKDFGQPIRVDFAEHPELKSRLIPGEDWQRVSSGHEFTEGPAVSPSGDVFFVDARKGEVWKIANPDAENPKTEKFAAVDGVSGLMFDREGNLFCACNRGKQVVRITPDGERTVVAKGMNCNDLVVVDHGIYVTSPPDSSIYYIPIDGGEATKVATGPNRPNGLIVTPDRRFLYVVDSAGRYVWSYRIEADGKLSAGQPYSYLHLPEDSIATGADGATMTKDGTLVVATALGLQIFDQPGRVHVITSRPTRSGKLTNCVFAGKDFQTLFVTVGGEVYRRKTKMIGIAPWQAAVAPPKPRL
ncbi:MAG: SMP-30/gluconolactonase/LRE family protein [Planctomycetota bacterium]